MFEDVDPEALSLWYERGLTGRGVEQAALSEVRSLERHVQGHEGDGRQLTERCWERRRGQAARLVPPLNLTEGSPLHLGVRVGAVASFART